jgi:hypothetical protein
MKRRFAFLGLCGVGLLAGLLSACSSGAGGIGILESHGDVRVGRVMVGAGLTRRLVANDLVTVAAGTAVVDLPAGGRLEMRAGTSVLFAATAQLEAGDLLVESGRQAVRVDSAVGSLAVAGDARVRRDLALEVGTYRGTTTVSAGRVVTVPALDQDTVPAVGVAPVPSPIHLQANDPWDERFLGTAIELTSQLDAQSAYVSANTVGADTHTVAFYRRAVVRLASTPAFTDALLASLPEGPPPPGDGLVAAAIALAGPGSFPSRWHDVFALRQAGGQWGVVTLAERADPGLVLQLVGEAVDGSTLAPRATMVAVGPVTATLPPPPAPALTTPPSTASTTTTQPTRPRPGHPTTTTTTTPPLIPPITLPGGSGSSNGPTTTTTQPPSSSLAPVLDPVVNIIHELG